MSDLAKDLQQQLAAERLKTQWQPIETAPRDIPHTRGVWVLSADTKRPLYFCANTGYIDEDGDFVSIGGEDDFGWPAADDYDWWYPLPSTLPEPPKGASE